MHDRRRKPVHPFADVRLLVCVFFRSLLSDLVLLSPLAGRRIPLVIRSCISSSYRCCASAACARQLVVNGYGVYTLPKHYTIPQDDCPICCEPFAGKTNLVRLKCNHYACFECLKDAAKQEMRGTMRSSPPDGNFPCPVCRQKCDLFERIQKPTAASATLSPEPLGSPLRSVSVEEVDGTVATGLASYYTTPAFVGFGSCIDNLDTLEELQGHQTIFQFTLFAARQELEKAWKRVATVHKTPEAIAEAFKWDRDAEDARAVLRHADDRITASQKSISRVTRQQIGPGHGGNKSDVTRYRVASSVGGIELSLRAENLRLTASS
ncbi:unnamed protein product [Vitrella brassicaformis CCMP3155]|uniref:RING-type domain-containing protein n=1 Tax=Vitrella brassicaformis (strain CCMP3155) TaxID=1169540 RepID=A0A0G4EV82_VITBC|nr:unnamed protein product [Vitrella brassicaformis CCMP3155]|eukprot:CEM02295.1 unnamed protein product [Vitrella brassicaformis CCMP3155]